MEKSVLYGSSAQEWLDRWDSGESVWSIEMGGLGPGYEQAIQITVAEILRFLLRENFDPAKWEDQEAWKKDYRKIEAYGFGNPEITKLGLTGAQFGAATNLACMLFKKGPEAVMADERVKDRHIQIEKGFPQ